MSHPKEALVPLGLAVTTSICVHGLLALLALLRPAPSPAPVPPDELLAEDRWAGTTLDLAYADDVGGGQSTPVAPSPPAPVATQAPEESKPSPSLDRSPDKADDAPKTIPREPAPRDKRATHDPPAKSPPTDAARSRAAAPAASGGPSSAGATGTFGMDTVATSHQLGRAFTAAIARTNQADESWSKRAVGDAGTLVFDVTIDDEGKATMARPIDPEHAPTHLVDMVKRTMFALRGGVFAVRGDVVSGTERLRIAVSVSDVQEEEIAGGHAAVGQRFENGHGRSSFTMANGRHVDIRIDVLTAAAPKRRD